MKYIVRSGIGLVLFFSSAGIPAGAQNSAPAKSQDSSSGSLGDYARQIRKAPSAGSKAKVFDNDNLPKDDKLSVVGKVTPAPENSAEAKPAEAAAEAPGGAESKTAADANASADAKGAADQKAPKSSAQGGSEEEQAKQAAAKQWADKLAAQQQQIDLLTRELEVLQREYQLRAAAMYADAGNRLRNSTDWDKQDAQYKQQIADKQKVLDDAKEKLDDLREQARKAGVPATTSE